MRNYFFYILIICSFTKTFGNDEEQNKSSEKESVTHTREYYEKEAKQDIENLLSSLTNQNFSEEDENNPVALIDNSKGSNKVMARIDHVLKNSKSTNKLIKDLRTDAQIYANNYQRELYLQQLPPNTKNAFESPNPYNFNANLNQNMKVSPVYDGNIKSRISGGRAVNTASRNGINYIDMKPEVYPLLITNAKYNSREPSEMDIIQTNDKIKYYTQDKDVFSNLVNHEDSNNPIDTVIKSATIPMSENFDLGGLISTLHIKGEEAIPTSKEADSNAMIHDFLNKFYRHSPPVNYLQPGNRVDILHNNLDGLNTNINSMDKENSQAIHLRSYVLDQVNSNTKDRFDEIMKYLDSGKDLRTLQNALSHNQTQSPSLNIASQDDVRSRHRRSTHAGYTQDPDTCKTYNDNLEKLWTNLSKIINIKDKPNDSALHNIAIMIQAYLEHQQPKPPETHKPKHEGRKDKISETMLRIKKLLETADSSHEKITKIIIKYLKPDYTDEIQDCQQINEEYLGISVSLLYKNYLDKTDCLDDAGDMTRNKKVSLRHRKVKGKPNMAHMPLSMANSDYEPEFQSILIEDESYNDFHKGKTQRKRPKNKNRRVFKPRPVYRSDNQNENENVFRRSKSSSKKSARNKHKKSTLKSYLEKGKCEKSAIRKLIVSLRPVMERYLGLLECKLDNTLRSASSSKTSEEYASQLYSLENSLRRRNNSHKLPTRQNNQSQKKLHTRNKNYQEGRARDNDDDYKTDTVSVRKYVSDKSKSANSAKRVEDRDTNVRVSVTDNNKQHSSDDYQYIQSPPQYDDYDGVYKTDHHAFRSLINPLISLNDKKNTRRQSRSKKLASFDKDDDYEDDDNYYDDDVSEETNYVFTNTEPIESSTKETPFVDLTKLRTEDQVIKEKNKIHVQTFESLTDFLKKARDESLQTPEFAVPFALDTKKGYVELTHLIKYPKTIVYRPQYLVKNTMPYDDFLKTINNSNMTNDNVRLMKIVRHLSDGSVQILFETEDTESPLEIRNLSVKDDNRRRGSPDPEVNYQSESRIDTAKENYNVDITDGNNEAVSPYDRNESRRKDVEASFKSDSSSTDVHLSSGHDLDSVGQSNTLRGNDELSQSKYFDDNSDTNSTSISKPNSSESGSSGFSSIPSLFERPPNPDFGNDVSSAIDSGVGSQVGAGTNLGLSSQIGSDMQMGVDTALNLDLKSSPSHFSQLGSFFSKLISSDSNTQATPNPSLNSQSHMNSQFDSSSGTFSASNSYSQLNSLSGGSWSNPSPSLVPHPDSNNQDKNFSSSTKSTIARWWRKWKNIVKGKIKQIIGKMGNIADNFDRVIKP